MAVKGNEMAVNYYQNDSAYGVRKAVALTLGVDLAEVELRHDGTGFYILRPKGANPDPAAVAAQTPPSPEPPTDADKKALEMAAPAKVLIVDEAVQVRANVAEAKAAGEGAKDLAALKSAFSQLAGAFDTVLAKMQGESGK